MRVVAKTESLSKWYGEVMGLNRFTATFAQGITGLVGPNGAGKSTLFKILVGQLRQDEGTVILLDQPIWNNVSLMKSIGYCPEHNQMYGWMTGEEFVYSLLKLSGLSSKEAITRTRHALDVVDMLSFKDKKLKTYSKGMRQRIKLAQALAHEPEVLILDEPLSGTDPIGRVKMINIIRELAHNGTSVLVSSHVLYEIERLTNRIVLINNGRAIAQGEIHEIRSIIDEHPHTVRLVTPMPREVAKILAGKDHVASIQFIDSEELIILTRNPEAFYKDLPTIVAENGLIVKSLESPDEGLEAVFRYLVK